MKPSYKRRARKSNTQSVKSRRRTCSLYELLEKRELMATDVIRQSPLGNVADAVRSIEVEFSAPLLGDSARNQDNFRLTYFGANGVAGGGDDVVLPVLPQYNDGSTMLRLSTLADLSTWSAVDYAFPPGIFGEWATDPLAGSVIQNLNGGATFFMSDAPIGVGTFRSQLQVDDTADNDYVGVVFGFEQNAETGLPDEYFILAWKRGSEGSSLGGMKLAKVSGTGQIGERPDLWNLSPSDSHVTVLGDGPDVSWNSATPYEIIVEQDLDSFTLSIVDGKTGNQIWQTSAANDSGLGRVGFYNFSQPNATHWVLETQESLDLGAYQLEIVSGGLLDATGTAIDGDRNGDAGGEYIGEFELVDEHSVLFVNVNGASYNADGQNFFQTVVDAGANATFINLDVQGEVAAALAENSYDQIWVFDLSGGTDNYPADWAAIANWYNARQNVEIITDARIISSYWRNRWQTEGRRLSENYYTNFKENGGGLFLGTDHDAFHGGINSINAQIGLEPFTGNFSLSRIPVDPQSPLMNYPNDLGLDLFDDSSPGQTPFGLQPNGRILYSAAWHSGNVNTPGISSTIAGDVGFRLDVVSPIGGTSFLEGQKIRFEAIAKAGTGPFEFEWSSNIDGRFGVGRVIEFAGLTPGSHTITVLGEDVEGGADTESFTLIVSPVAAEIQIQLQAGSDTGLSDDDRISSDNTPSFDIAVNKAGRIKLYANAGAVPIFETLVDQASIVPVTIPSFADGVHNLRAEFTPNIGNPDDAVISVTIDTLGPTLVPGATSEQAPISQKAVQFSEAIDLNRSVAEGLVVSISGPQGTFPISNITGSGATYTLSFPTLTQPGVYTISANGAIWDVAGNQIASPPQQTFTLLADTTSPSVVKFTPLGLRNANVTQLEIEFSEAIRSDSFTVEDVKVALPVGGQTTPTSIAPSSTDGRRFIATFATPLSQAGEYSVTVGPDIADLSGNTMSGYGLARSTILTFEPTVENRTDVSQAYGDRVTSTLQDGFRYGSGVLGPYTPNITVEYGPSGDDIHHWDSGYGDLQDVIYRESDGAEFLEIVLRADAGFEVLLSGFDLAGWPYSDYTLPGIQILDAQDEILFQATDVYVEGNGSAPGHSSLRFEEPLSAGLILIRLDLRGMGGNSDDVGIDNIAFSQVAAGATSTGTYQASFTIDKTGPRVVSAVPGGTVNNSVSHLDVTFSEPIAIASLTASDLQLTGPSGQQIAVTSIQSTGGNSYRFGFASQSANGSYSVSVGPGIDDAAGNGMDQNQDGVSGDGFLHEFTIGLPDLVVDDSLKLTKLSGENSAEFKFGELFNVGWAITNSGTLQAAGGTDRIWLSIDNTLSANDVLLGSKIASANAVPAGGGYSATSQVQVPLSSSRPEGPYYLIVETDATKSIVESSESNNTRAIPVTLKKPPLPDLLAQSIATAGPLTAGSPFTLSWQVANTGFAAANGPWTERVYISNSSDGANRQLLASFNYSGAIAPSDPPLARGEAITLPLTSLNGPVYFVVEIDATSSVDESDENNTFISQSSYSIPPALALSFDATSVTEGAAAIQGTVTRNGSTAQPLTVTLTPSVANQLNLPATVTIPAGQYSLRFNVAGLADGVTDGNVLTQVSATASGFLAATQPLTVIDTDLGTLTLTATNTVTEGGSLVVTISRPTASSQPLLVSLATTAGSQWTVPAGVLIPANETQAQFTIETVSDIRSEKTETVSLTATAAGYNPAQFSAQLVDDDVPVLSLSVNRSSILESDNAHPIVAAVSRQTVTAAAVRVKLSSNDASEAIVPSEVIIPAGQASVTFLITPVDDSLLDGTQSVLIRANGAYDSCGCTITTGFGEATIEVLDDESPALLIETPQELFREGLSPAGQITLNRLALSTDTDLTVTLASSHPNKLTLPASVVIPAGQISVTVPFNTIGDGVTTGDTIITITATAPGLASAVRAVTVTDVDVPDLVVSQITLPPTGLTGESPTISWTTKNNGQAAAVGTWTERVFLSSDNAVGNDILVGQYTFSGPVGPGQSYSRTAPIQLPNLSGKYWLVVEADVSDIVREGLETNNSSVSPSFIEVAPAYSAVVMTDVETAPADTPVLLKGVATRANGSPAALQQVNVHLSVRGTKRTLPAVTKADGTFQVLFTPLPGEGGNYTIGAAHPGLPDAPVQDSFKLVGMRAEPPARTISVKEGDPAVGDSLLIRNLADVPLTGLTIDVLDLPANLQVTTSFSPNATTLAAMGTLGVNYTVAATNPSVQSGTFRLRINSNEAPDVVVPVSFNVVPLVSRLVAEPGSLSKSMLVGDQTSVEFTIRNTGGLPTGPLSVLLPSGAAWLSLGTAATMPSLDPGTSTSITLLLTPPEALALTAYNGSLVVRGDSTQVEVPFSFRAISEETGDLEVTVVDEFFFFTEEKPLVTDAAVVLRDAITGAIIATSENASQSLAQGGVAALGAAPTVTIDDLGRVKFSGVAEGPYTLEVRADKHESYSNTVRVTAGQLSTNQVFISRNLVEYVWTVEEIEIEDRTRIVIDAVFETNVPAPVVTMQYREAGEAVFHDGALLDLAELQVVGQTKQVEIKITNHGFIAANDVAFDFGEHDYYEITPLIETIGVLPAKSELVIPVIVRRTAVPTDGDGDPGDGDPGDGDPGDGDPGDGDPGDGDPGDGDPGDGDPGDGDPGDGDPSDGDPGDGDPGDGDPGDGDPGDGDPGGTPQVACFIPAKLIWSYVCDEVIQRAAPIAVLNVEGVCPTGEPVSPGGGGGGGGGPSGPGGIVPVYIASRADCNCDPNDFDKADLLRLDLGGYVKPAVDFINNGLGRILGPWGVQPRFTAPVVGGARTCCRPDGTIGVELFGNVGAQTALNIGRGVIIEQSVNIGALKLGKVSFKGGEFITPTWYGSGEISSNCGEEPTVTYIAGFKVSHFEGIQGNVQLAPGVGPVGIGPKYTGSIGNEDLLLVQFESKSTTPLLQESDRLTFQAIIDQYPTDPVGLIQAMSTLPGELRWSYFSEGIRYGASFEYEGSTYQIADDPNTPEIEEWAYYVEPYEFLEPNRGNAESALVSWTDEEVRSLGIWDLEIDEIIELVQAAVVPTQLRGSSDAPETPKTIPGLAAIQGNGVCAQVQIQIEQEAVLTRTAFQARLQIANNSLTSPVENLVVQLSVTDENGNLVNELFGITLSSQTGVSNDGSSIGAGGLGRLSWTLIPASAAASSGPSTYYVSGLMSYSIDGQSFSVPLTPSDILVRPDAELDLRYFLQRDVISDDPHSDEIEPAQPFTLAVLAQNNGAGEARNFRIESAQPKIIENEKGLLIDFEITGTKVNGGDVQRSLTANFGTIVAGGIGIAEWQMEASLQGHFVDYKVSFQHESPFGDNRLSLIKSATIHELIHVVDAQQVDDDGLSDFLVNDLADPNDLPDTLYLSDGSVVAVGLGTSPVVQGTPTLGNMRVTVAATMAAGWSYLKLSDPSLGDFKLVGVERSDGSLLPADNFWQTDRTFIGGGQRPTLEDNIHLLDYDSTGSYTLIFSNGDVTGPAVASFAGVVPNPTTQAIDVIDVAFTERLADATFDAADVTLTKNGAGVPLSGISIVYVSGSNYRISGLAPFTSDDAVYELKVDAATLTDQVGNSGIGSKSYRWVKGETAPAVIELIGAPSGLVTAGTSSIDIVFSKPIQGLDLTDLTLTRGGANLLDAQVTIAQVGASTYRVGNLARLTATDGTYHFAVNAAGVQDTVGNVGLGATTSDWTLDATAPQLVDVINPATNPRNIVVQQIDVEFSEPIDMATLDLGDLRLTRDGGTANLLPDSDARVSFEHRGGNVYRIKGINWFQAFTAEPQIADFTLFVDAAGVSDLAGNVGSGLLSSTWTIDLDCPLAAADLVLSTFSGPVTDGQVNARQATVSGKLAESGLTVAIRDMTTNTDLVRQTIDGAAFSFPIEFPSAGQHRLRVRTVDPAGNTSDTFIENLFVSETPPIVELISGLPDGKTRHAVDFIDVRFVAPIVSSSLQPSSLMISRNGAPLDVDGKITIDQQSDGRTFRFTGLSQITLDEGRYDLTLSLTGVKNAAGITISDVRTATWINDHTAPTSSVKTLEFRQDLNSIIIDLIGDDPALAGGGSPAGIAAFDLYYSDNGAPFQFLETLPANAPTTTFVAEPNHLYYFRSVARDTAGNIESKANQVDAWTYVPDLFAPQTQVVTVDSTDATFEITMSGIDSGVGMQDFRLFVQVDGGALQRVGLVAAGQAASDGTYSATANYQAISDGAEHEYRFFTRGADLEGNLESEPDALADVLVSAQFAAPPQTSLVDFDVQKGADQRSFIRYLDLLFNNSSQLSALVSSLNDADTLNDRIRLTRFGLDGVSGATDVNLANRVRSVDQALEFDFGADGLGGERNGLAGDGYYRLALDLDGNGSLETELAFFRLFGDVDGNGKVDDADLGRLTPALGQVGANLNGDLNGDGRVNAIDRQAWQRGRGRALASSVKLDD